MEKAIYCGILKVNEGSHRKMW